MSYSFAGAFWNDVTAVSKNTDPIALWCSLFAYAGRQISADQFGPVARLSNFVEAGWLVPVAHTATVLCEVCEEPHWADVEVIDQNMKGICRRSGEAFAISRSTSLYHVDGDKFSLALARALDTDGRPRRVRGLETVWSLGAVRLNDMRIAIFCTPTLGQIDLATTILASVADQSRSTANCLLVTDEIDAVRLLQRNSAVVRLRDVAHIEPTGTLNIDSVRLIAAVFPGIDKPRRRGRPPDQRERIVKLLDESDSGGPIDTSNESLGEWSLKYKRRFKAASPSRTTIREAISIWNARRGFTSSSR
mgnify:CR=1 FL=1|jgi:hypothetical protein